MHPRDETTIIDAILSEDPLSARIAGDGLIEMGSDDNHVTVSPSCALAICNKMELEARKNGSEGSEDVIDWISDVRRLVMRINVINGDQLI